MASYEISALSEVDSDPRSYILQKFRLYETRSRFYMIGRNKHQTLWRVLKIDRLEPTELNIHEDCTTYSEAECCDLLNRIHEGNRSTGGLKFVTVCYGIIGFIKFLGPYYMLLITKRRQIGSIGGHAIYSITKTEMIPIPNSTLLSNMALSKSEDRYKKLLGTLDLTKDFFFSYSYHVMRSLQKNLCDGETGQVLYKSMFVWNEFLTHRIRNDLKNTLWTVALVYGFFKQAKLSISGRYFNLTLIARRSRYYAGTRYLKRGVNEKGRVANDVETEQIVFEDTPEGCPAHMSSVVQHRGSIPLFWSQEASGLNIKPDIIVSKKDQNYQATRTHFDDLVKRYGNPIIIFNLIKTRERKPRESKLRTEFAKAIETINQDLYGESRLKFLHWDLHKHARSKDTNVLALLDNVAEDALDLTGFFHSQVLPELRFGVSSEWLNSRIDDVINSSTHDEDDVVYLSAHDNDVVNLSSHDDIDNNRKNVEKLELRLGEGKVDANGKHFAIPLMLQKGVLRTNCIDCLDRTNVAQYAYGFAALGRQLHALGFIDIPKIDSDSPLNDVLMRFYEAMGNTLALQYGGSAAHNMIFSDRRGHWRVATRPQEFFRGLQRFYSNTYMDAEKQDAINIFLGYFQPQQNEHALWELDSDQHYDVGRHDLTFGDENSRPSLKRSASYDNIVCERDTPVSSTNVGQKKPCTSVLLEKTEGDNNRLLSDSTSDISICESDISYGRYTPLMARGQRLAEMRNDQIRFGKDAYNCSNFVDVERLSSRSSSYEDLYEKSTLIHSMSSENVVNGITDLTVETTSASSEHGSNIKGSNVVGEFSNNFVHWVAALCQWS